MDNFISVDFGTTACRTAYDKDGSFELFPNRYSDGRVPLLIERLKEPGVSFNFSSIKQKIGLEEEVAIDGKKSRIIDLAADMFRGIRDDAKTNSGEALDNVVVTVPAGFSEKQRAAMRTAAEKAGFTFVKLLDESAALILGAGIKDEGKLFLVYSLGGGIFTVSVFRILNGLPKALCHEGDRHLGGYNFDASLIHHLLRSSGSSNVLHNQKYASIVIAQ
jgi:molecular chaperone DnaK (HSP70)